MKKKYEFWASEKNISKLKLYTKLIGIFFGSLGVNFLLVFFYWKFILQYANSVLILLLSITMFVLAPITMKDPKKSSRDLVAVVSYGVLHGICTIGSVIVTRFGLLLIVYVIEILIVVLLLIQNFKADRN